MPECIVCHEDKPDTEFTPEPKNKRTGLRGECRQCRADGDRFRRYKLTPERFIGLFEAQFGLCAICEKPISVATAKVDHDHWCCPSDRSCGECVRGLLCSPCNGTLGHWDDDPDIFDRAIRYLTRNTHGHETI